MSKKFKILLIASLILNAFLMSFVGGKMYQHKTMKRGSAPLVSLLENASISEQVRSELIAKLKKSSPDRNQKMQSRRVWEEKAHDILVADIFDEAAYRAQLEERFLRNKPKRAVMIDTMVEIATTLNQEDRAKMARILKRQSKNTARHRREK